jgi:hypothetical protein
MFRPLHAHPQEVLNKLRVMSGGCTRVQPPEDEQVMLEIYHHHHHHHVQKRGVRRVACSLILKVNLVSPSLPRSS